MEKPVNFESQGKVVRGVLHLPEGERDAGPAVVFLHGWTGCRLGPHRMFVKTARRLAKLGFCCLRFDFTGRGESAGATQDGTIRSMISDTGSAVDFLLAEAPVGDVVLLGICSGCKVAIGAAAEDKRIGHLALWSAEPMGRLRSTATNRRKSLFAFRDYLGKLMRIETWRKILTGRVNTAMVGKAMFDHEAPDRTETEDETGLLERFRSAFKGSILFVYGTNDPDTKLAGIGYRAFCDEAGIKSAFREIEGSNHSFYSLEWEQQVMDITERWLKERA
jgi:dienelactone hydrolase